MKKKLELVKEIISTLSPNELEEIIKDIERRLRESRSKSVYPSNPSRAEIKSRLKDIEEGKNLMSREEFEAKMNKEFGQYLK